jgi:ATP-binding cassette subfamily F protein uup
MLVLDEPTNDLDVETLELLESLLVEYSGTVLLVSHDRAFLDNVVTSTLVIETGGRVKEYDGGYSDYVRQRPVQVPAEPKSAPPSAVARSAGPPAGAPRKLSYREQKELETLPGRIEQLEARRETLHQVMADPAFYRKEGSEIAGTRAELETLEQELAAAYARWETLEAISG